MTLSSIFLESPAVSSIDDNLAIDGASFSCGGLSTTETAKLTLPDAFSRSVATISKTALPAATAFILTVRSPTTSIVATSGLCDCAVTETSSIGPSSTISSSISCTVPRVSSTDGNDAIVGGRLNPRTITSNDADASAPSVSEAVTVTVVVPALRGSTNIDPSLPGEIALTTLGGLVVAVKNCS